MAKALSQLNMEREVEENQGSTVNDEDVEIAVRMAVDALDNGGMKVLRDAIDKSTDPAMVIGQFLAQLMGQLAEQLQQQYDIDPKIFLAKNGWLDIILDFIEAELGYPSDFSDEVYQQVLEVIKAAASTPDAPNNVTDPNAQQGALPPQPAAPNPVPVPEQPPMGGM